MKCRAELGKLLRDLTPEKVGGFRRLFALRSLKVYLDFAA
jgi:hypothetical protein